METTCRQTTRAGRRWRRSGWRPVSCGALDRFAPRSDARCPSFGRRGVGGGGGERRRREREAARANGRSNDDDGRFSEHRVNDRRQQQPAARFDRRRAPNEQRTASGPATKTTDCSADEWRRTPEEYKQLLSHLPKDKLVAVRAATAAYHTSKNLGVLVAALSSTLLPEHVEAFKAFHGFLAAEHKEPFVRHCKERRLC
uniref:Uncharacterized protein n=1 Tax=Plectus sambesii TaxID=2011161 RepID=A0A914XGB3_9BILA